MKMCRLKHDGKTHEFPTASAGSLQNSEAPANHIRYARAAELRGGQPCKASDLNSYK
jgi:hypothetical protein